MHSKNTNKFDDLLRDKVAHHEFEYQEGQWGNMQNLLQQQAAEDARKGAIWLSWPRYTRAASIVAAACLLLAAGWFLRGSITENNTPATAHMPAVQDNLMATQPAEDKAGNNMPGAQQAAAGQIAMPAQPAGKGPAAEVKKPARTQKQNVVKREEIQMADKQPATVAVSGKGMEAQNIDINNYIPAAPADNMRDRANNKYALIELNHKRAERNEGVMPATVSNTAEDNRVAKSSNISWGDSSISNIPQVAINRNTLSPNAAAISLENPNKGRYHDNVDRDIEGHRFKLGFAAIINTSTRLGSAKDAEGVTVAASANGGINLFMQYNINKHWAIETGLGIISHSGKYLSWTGDTLHNSFVPGNDKVVTNVISETSYADFPLLARYRLHPRLSVFSGFIISSMFDYTAYSFLQRPEEVADNVGGLSVTNYNDMASYSSITLAPTDLNKLARVDVSIPVGINYHVLKRFELEGGARIGLTDATRRTNVKFEQKAGKYNNSLYVALRYRLIR